VQLSTDGRTIVHLLRHGKVHNPKGILYGRLPGFYLSESGLKMAEIVAASLAGNDVTYVAASSLLRAQQTAQPIAASHQLEIVTDDRVIEADNVFAGTQVVGAGGSLKQPKNWLKLRDPFTPSWGEPYLRIAQRVLAAVYAAVDAAAGHEAVIVSHQLPIWTLRRFLTGNRLWHSPTSRQCGLASITSLHFTDGVFTDVNYSEPAGHILPEDDAPAGQP
jgi:broad specificity phosphatase PhoE